MIFGRATFVRASLVALGVVATLLVAVDARANGRFPSANQLVVQPREPSRILLRTTFGFLSTADAGKTWDWLCESAIGYSGTQDPPFALTEHGGAIVALWNGLSVSRDAGCGWGFVAGALSNLAFVDVAVRPNAPESAVALSGTFHGAGDAGSRFDSRVFETDDDGATWIGLGTPLDPTLTVETIEVAASDPNRIYISATRGDSVSITAFLVVSTDRGATWTLHTVPLQINAYERAPYIAAVDPNDADRVYVRTVAPSTSRLLVTDDAGQSFHEVYAGGLLRGFALSSDGSKAYLGGPTDGLLVASTTDMAFAPRSPVSVECLTTSGATLYACSSEASGFIVGASLDDGATFTPILHLATIRGPLACPSNASAAACTAEWGARRDQLEGAGDGGAAHSAPAAQSTSAPSCGFYMGHGSEMTFVAAFAFLVGMGGVARGRRQRGP